jgi:predicted DNA-binding transcriptional regulator AlpA
MEDAFMVRWSHKDTMYSAYAQYRREVQALPRLTVEQEQALVERARQGDREALPAMVQGCLPYVLSVAARTASRYEHSACLDVVQVGNLALVEHVERSLSFPDPFGYLRKTARMRMLTSWGRDDPLILTPRYHARREVVSLDEPFDEEDDLLLADVLAEPDVPPGSGERDYQPLYEAVEALPEVHRQVVQHLYGLAGHASVAAPALARALFPHASVRQRQHAFDGRHVVAMRHLQRQLAAVYLPHACQAPDEFYTLREVMALAGVSKHAVYQWAANGKLTSYPAPDSLKGGGLGAAAPQFVYDKHEVDDWLVRRRLPRAVNERRSRRGRQDGETAAGENGAA